MTKRPTDPAVQADIIRVYRSQGRRAAVSWISSNLGIEICERTFCSWIQQWRGRKADCNDDLASATSPDSVLAASSHHSNAGDGIQTTVDNQRHDDSFQYIVPQDIGRPDSPVLGTYDLVMNQAAQPMATLGKNGRLIVNQNDFDEPTLARSAETFPWHRSGSLHACHNERGNRPFDHNDRTQDRHSGSAGCISPVTNPRLSKDSGYCSSAASFSTPWSSMPIRSVEGSHGSESKFQRQRTTDHLSYLPPHAGHSECPLATGTPYNALLDRENCSLCNATSAHFLGIMAHTLQPTDLVQRLRALPNLNQSDSYGNTPVLFVSSANPTLQLFRIFQDQGARLSATNHFGDTILHLLDIKRFHNVQDMIQLLEWCESQDVSMRQRRIDGQTILHALIRRTNDPTWISHLEKFFARRSIFMHSRDSSGSSPSDISKGIKPRKIYRPSDDEHESYDNLQARMLEMRQTVNESIRRPETEDHLGRNGISCLAYISDLNANVRLKWLGDLLRNGVDVNHYDKDGYTPLHSFMLLARHPRTAGSDEGETNECISELLRAGADVRLQDRAGNTALHLACRYGRVLCVDRLLQNDSLVNATNKAGRTVISEARRGLSGADSLTLARIEEAIDKVKRCGGVESLHESG